MKEFVFLFRHTQAAAQGAIGNPDQAKKTMQGWLAWVRELESSGNLSQPGQPLQHDGKVVGGAKMAVTDGPFVEAKDMVLGYLIVRATDLDHAAELAKGCPIALGGGTVEVRPVFAGMA